MYDLTIELQNDSDKCLYEQIYEHIRQEIREGKFLCGERLPSTRSLAEYLQVSRSTVDVAYAQLLSEGYIESRPYRGYFVCRMEELFQLETCKKSRDAVRDGVSTQAGDTIRAGVGDTARFGGTESVSKVPEIGRENRGVRYDFSPNGIDMSAFPFSVWRKITRNVLCDGSSSLYLLGDPQGDYELRLTISRYLHSSRGVNCSPDQIIIGAGNDYLLLLLEKIWGPNVRIAMENPTYKRAYRIFKACGYDITAVAMDESGMQVEALEQENVTAAYVMPSHQHPTGRVMPIGRRTELLHWANRKEERYLIEDDYDSEFRYRGKPIPSLQSSDKHGKVIYIGTFSKAIAPAIRISYMILPPILMERYHRQCFFYSSTVSRIDQRTLNEFIRDGYFERHLNKMRKLYRAKHELMLRCLEPFAGNFKLSGENAGLHLLLTSSKGLTEEELINRANEYQVKVYGLSDSLIWDIADKEGTVLLGFGALTQEQIIKGIGQLKKAWL